MRPAWGSAPSLMLPNVCSTVSVRAWADAADASPSENNSARARAQHDPRVRAMGASIETEVGVDTNSDCIGRKSFREGSVEWGPVKSGRAELQNPEGVAETTGV